VWARFPFFGSAERVCESLCNWRLIVYLLTVPLHTHTYMHTHTQHTHDDDHDDGTGDQMDRLLEKTFGGGGGAKGNAKGATAGGGRLGGAKGKGDANAEDNGFSISFASSTKQMHTTLSHGGKHRHVAGVFADSAARKDAENEFEDVLEDAMQQKQKEATIHQRHLTKKEKEEQMRRDAEEEKIRLEEEQKQLEDDTSHLMQEEIEDRERAARQKAAFNKMKLFFKRQMAVVSRAFVDYGPPYKEENLMDGVNLIAQCSNYPVRLFDLHLMLNERVNPNMRDPEDLHYASMHWAARNFSTIAMKMLRHAGADINIRNELDQTPLTMCVIVKQTDRRKYQLKALKYMIAEGAEINTRDKAGFGPVVSNGIFS
jgi:ribosomal protein L14E/L6E/L27E